MKKHEIILAKGDLEAIKGSIKKWEIVALLHKKNHFFAAQDVGDETTNCDLCIKYYSPKNWKIDSCPGCPFYERLGISCFDDEHPFMLWHQSMNTITAKRMVRSLKDLLPKKKKGKK